MPTFADELKALAKQTEPSRKAKAEQERLEKVASATATAKQREKALAKLAAQRRAEGQTYVDTHFDALQTRMRNHVATTGHSSIVWISQHWNDRDPLWCPNSYAGAIKRLKQHLGKGFTINGNITPHHDARGDCWGYDMTITICW